MFLMAEPRKTGEKRRATVARRMAWKRSAGVGSWSLRKISARVSSTSARVAISSARFSLASARTESGISSDSMTSVLQGRH